MKNNTNSNTEIRNLVVESYSPYNQRRYGRPWVAKIVNGKYEFDNVGMYTGNHYEGGEGDLVIHKPEEGQVYAYGQKDYRKNRPNMVFVKYENGWLQECDKLGKIKE